MNETYTDFLSKMTQCPFCNEIGNRPVVERKHAMLTYALAPYHKHHLLVVPHRHVLSIDDLAKEEESEIEELQRVGLNLLRKLGYENITLMVREGKVQENKSIAHTHFHIVPYVQIGDLNHFGEQRRVLSHEEIQALLSELKSVLS